MNIKISMTTALAMCDATPRLHPDLRHAIESAHGKTDEIAIQDVPHKELRLGLEGVRAFMATNSSYNEQAYKHILAELEFLVDASAH